MHCRLGANQFLRKIAEEEGVFMTVRETSAVVLRAHRTDLSQAPSSVLEVTTLPTRELGAGQVRVRNLFQQVIAASGDLMFETSQLPAPVFRTGEPVYGNAIGEVVSGAAGGVGSMVAQIAKARGATYVIGIAGGPEKAHYLIDELGLDAAIDYHNHDLDEQLGRLAPEASQYSSIPSVVGSSKPHSGTRRPVPASRCAAPSPDKLAATATLSMSSSPKTSYSPGCIAATS